MTYRNGREIMIVRRTLVAGLASVATTPVFAQNTMTPPSSGTALGAAENQFIQQTTQIGSLSLALSRIAEPKVRAAKLREFARFEIAEQETVGDVLKSLHDPRLPIQGTVPSPSDADVESHIQAQDRELVEKMRAAPAGSDFDRDYVKAQTDGHEKLLRIQEDYLTSGQNLGAVNVSKLARGMIKEHLQLLSDLRSEIG
jgi:putative membrane protein